MTRPNPTIGMGLLLVSLGLILPQCSDAQDKAEHKRGGAWPDVFISASSLGMYHVVFDQPVMEKGDMPKVYRQKANYHWSGGRFEIVQVTLARDPAFKDQFSPEVLRKEKNPPRELEINKKLAWHWKFAREGRKLDEVSQRLIIVLDTDKAIIIEQLGYGLNLEEMAKRFDFAKIDKALANPPAK